MSSISKKTMVLSNCLKVANKFFKSHSSLQEFKEASTSSMTSSAFQLRFNSTYAASPFLRNTIPQRQSDAIQVDKKCISTSASSQSATATITPEQVKDGSDMYCLPLRYIHWIMATGIISVILLVQLAMNTENKDSKGFYMMLHKSIGFTLGFLTLGRLFYRASSIIPDHLPGSPLEIFAATLSHQTLYALMVFMPLTGVLMGYYGGKGIPFFGLTIPGASEQNRDSFIAKASFKTHKLAGQIFYYLLPVHFGAALYHQYFHAQNIFRRVNPLAKLAA